MNTLPGFSHEASLLIFALLAVIGLVVLIARFNFRLGQAPQQHIDGASAAIGGA